MTTRKPFNALTKKTILIDLQGQPIICTFPGCKCQAQDIHHVQYVSKDGTNEMSNLTPMCRKHHIQLHSTRGDFREWGKKGGKATAASGKSLKNLKQYRNKQIEVQA